MTMTELMPLPKDAQLNCNHAAPVDWSMFLLLLACLFSFRCCLSRSAFDLHILKLIELMKDVEAEATEKQLTDQLPLS